MFTQKQMVLPILGMIILLLFITLAYVRESVFMDKILVCSFIITTVFIARVRAKSN
ncbi:hypothetical protein GCM10023330_02790 [Litoribaculum gwangyangense]|jgi:hypothetical protein|uniref:Uncharacterized protein n=1 Tax=Litoribaculum gwangyangense TaxID=1130722 RepID=A0ABP9BV77_9FLAO